MRGSRRYGWDKGSVTHGHTDGRTDIHGGKNNICLPQGETYNKSETKIFWKRFHVNTFLLKIRERCSCGNKNIHYLNR